MNSGSGLKVATGIPACSRISAAYIRVSTEEQNLDLQESLLKAQNPDRMYSDKDSGSNVSRTAYMELCKDILAGDIREVLVYRIDRIGRDPVELVRFFWELLDKYNVEITSLMEPFAHDWNKSSWAFRATWDAIGDAKYEILRLKERQRAGIDAAQDMIRRGLRTRGMGRPPGPGKKKQRKSSFEAKEPHRP